MLTVSTAIKYFGNEDAIGKLIRVNNDVDYVVTGLAADCPSNSQIKFDALASWSTLTGPVYTTESWFDASHYTYLLLGNSEMYEPLRLKIRDYFDKLSSEEGFGQGNNLAIRIEPMTKVHLHAIVDGGLEPGSDYRYIYIFSVVALFILAIACANYVNLTTARASGRAREVGLRKVVGASRRQLIGQFLGESLFIVLIAFAVSIVLVQVALPGFTLLAGKHFTIVPLLKPGPLVLLTTVLLGIGFLSGTYPAFVLSGFSPVRVFRGKLAVGSSGTSLRKSLIVVQFIISVGLVASTLVVGKQLSFIQQARLGYDKEHVIVLSGDRALGDRMAVVKEEFLANLHVESIALCNQTPVFVPGKYSLAIDDRETIQSGLRVDRDFISTMHIRMLEGADFTLTEEQNAVAGRDTVARPIIINEAAVRSFGWDLGNAIGRTVLFQGRESVVKGVVGDFHFTSLHEAIQPIILFLSQDARKILVRVSGNQLPETLTFLKSKWNELVPQLPFEYEFLDDQFDKLYVAETRTGKILSAFSVLGIVLASLGLLGLITFISQQRTQEIGIRRVLGASLFALIKELSGDLLKLVAAGTVIAVPIVWVAMDNWLQSFAYRTALSWWMILLACAPAVLIALLTVTFQAAKAAMANPVDALRNQ